MGKFDKICSCFRRSKSIKIQVSKLFQENWLAADTKGASYQKLALTEWMLKFYNRNKDNLITILGQ